MKNLILCGFMGCGKTTIGFRLARLFSMEYIDLDAELEQSAGLPIPEIFAQYGEAYFRNLEHQAVAGIAKRIRCVVSTGGGALTFARNRETIDPRDTVIFLDTPFDVCYSRIKDSGRPIVRSTTADQLQSLFNQRRDAYLAASAIRIDGALPVEKAAQSIVEILALS